MSLKVAGIKETMFSNRVKSFYLNRILKSSYNIEDLKAIEAISPESGRSAGGAATGVVAGAVLLGPIGAVAGGLLGMGARTIAVKYHLKDGESFVAETKSKHLVKIIEAFENSNK